MDINIKLTKDYVFHFNIFPCFKTSYKSMTCTFMWQVKLLNYFTASILGNENLDLVCHKLLRNQQLDARIGQENELKKWRRFMVYQLTRMMNR